jgi:hypothetical protein
MEYFQTKNPNLGKFWRVLQWNMLVYFMDIWSIYGQLVYVVVIWYIFPHFGMLYQEKSGNPVVRASVSCFNEINNYLVLIVPEAKWLHLEWFATNAVERLVCG